MAQLYIANLSLGTALVQFRTSFAALPATTQPPAPLGVRIARGTQALIWDDAGGTVAAASIVTQLAPYDLTLASTAIATGALSGLIYSLTGPIDMAAVQASFAAHYTPDQAAGLALASYVNIYGGLGA